MLFYAFLRALSTEKPSTKTACRICVEPARRAFYIIGDSYNINKEVPRQYNLPRRFFIYAR